MSHNIHVIVLTSCCYLQAGLKGLLAETLIPLRLLQASSTGEVCKQLATTEAEMIIVARESGTPAGRARTRAQLRHLDWMMSSGAIQKVPCLLLAEDMSITLAGKSFRLTRTNTALDLEILVGGILAHPEKYLGMSKWSALSVQQQAILDGTLAGLDIYELAERMNILPHTVFAHRDVLIKKLGLRNRMELMCLNAQDFTE
ncbi:helix-turn-helix transcriptional regulator [Salmonella enterica]|nr:helix-turn-helix transcriptional regulator [Salmonella enterica]EJF4883272.1 helix-turn-helix transcriptional regulator [Salmonella enterica]